MSRFLKRLELQGFKSFALKTGLEFPENVTAIVGPNGTGKTNIVDAFRCVLGEREARQLRGGKSENLIFSGSPGKPAASLAQVSLTFENKGGLFSFDAEEVNLSRKIFKSGTSKYFCNRSEILWRDLAEMLSRAKMGSRGFSIITQGNSDIFVESSPQERREMIEEILGLKEFRLKKDQAERRLDSTQRNFEKVKITLEELEPRLKVLRRQSRKWLEREEMEKELKTLEGFYFSSRLAGIKKETDAIEAGLADCLTKMAAKQKELDGMNAELDEKYLHSDFIKKVKDFLFYAKKIIDSVISLGKVNDMRNQLKSLSMQIGNVIAQESFGADQRVLLAAMDERRNELSRLADERSRLEFEKERRQDEIKKLEIQISTSGCSAVQLASVQESPADIPDMEAAEKKIVRLRAGLASIGEIESGLVEEAREVEERFGFLSKQLKDLEAASGDLKKMIHDLEAKIRGDFEKSIGLISKEFDSLCRTLFGGGQGRLKLTARQTSEQENEEENQEIEPVQGVEIDVALPKKKISGLGMLSGGEKSLVSLAALFSLISVNPPPFLVLDEVDAALDDQNAQRFSRLVKSFSGKTQFVLVTHNRITMSAADILYGVTMDKDGVSKILSLKLGG